MVQQHSPIAQARNQVQVVADNHQGGSLFLHLMDTVKALALEGLVTHSQNLINKEDIRAGVHCDSESQTQEHTRGVELHLGVDKLLNLRKGDNIVKSSFDLLFTHAQNCAVEKNIFTARQVRVEARTDFNEACHASAVSHRALVRSNDT